VLQRLDPLIVSLSKVSLSSSEFNDLYFFLRDGLLDTRALPASLCTQVMVCRLG
jgi:hypothetical protein